MDAVARTGWRQRARDEQMPPEDADWIVWLLLAGRGFGKTRTGAEMVRTEVAEGRASRIALIAATAGDVRSVMVEGESGLMSVANPPLYEPSLHRLTWENGAIATCYSADEPQRLRGPQHDFAWLRIRLLSRERGEDGAADATDGVGEEKCRSERMRISGAAYLVSFLTIAESNARSGFLAVLCCNAGEFC